MLISSKRLGWALASSSPPPLGPLPRVLALLQVLAAERPAQRRASRRAAMGPQARRSRARLVPSTKPRKHGAAPGSGEAGEGSQPSGPKKPGKKPRDLLKTAANLMSDFGSATPANEAYFGKSWVAHGRSCKRLQDVFEKKLDSTKDMAEYKQLQMAKKQVHNVISICRFLHSHGSGSDGLAEMFDKQLHSWPWTRQPLLPFRCT